MKQWSISLDCFDRGLLRHKPMRKAWVLLHRSHLHHTGPAPVAGATHTGPAPAAGATHTGPAPAAHPGPARRAVTRHGWRGRLHRGDPFTNARRAAHPGPTPAKAYPGPAPAGVPPDSLGHRLIPARMADGCASRAPPWCRPQGFLRGGAITDLGQARGRDQGSEWN